jgi:hypothetical protein
MTGLETLKERRIKACDKFAEKCLKGKFEHWFPKRSVRGGLRKGKIYVEEYARTDRLKKSPKVRSVDLNVNTLYPKEGKKWEGRRRRKEMPSV